MKTEQLITILKKHPGAEVLIHDSSENEFYGLEPDDVGLAYTANAGTSGAHDLVVLSDDMDSDDYERLTRALVLWSS